MSPAITQSEPLLKWISSTNHQQLDWINNYLGNRLNSESLSTGLWRLGDYDQVQTTLHGLLGTPQGRELIQKMRAAWYQRQYRAKLGKQVSFQIPNHVAVELATIAKDRNQSKTQTLRQIIHDAATQHKERKSKLLRANRKLKDNLERLSSEKQMSESVRNEIIDTLLQELAKEIESRTGYEVALGPIWEEELEEYKDERYYELLRKRVTEIERRTQWLPTLKSGLKSLSHYLRTTSD